jgi:membrane associated rhomboid family serine protease
MTKSVKHLLIINVAVFVVDYIARAFGSGAIIYNFGLIPREVTYGFAFWRLVTYMFLHGGIWHIFFNMFTLFMFGNDLARRWGPQQFLRYYFVTGVGAGIFSWLADLDGTVVIVGASGAIYALLLAYGLYYPNRIVYIYLLFPVKIKWLVTFMGVMAFLSSFTGSNPGVAHIAHLGGMAIGYALIRGSYWWERLHAHRAHRKREELKRQFELYYGDVRRSIDEKKKKGPTIH